MALATLNYFSRSLHRASTLTLIFPDDPPLPSPWPVLYLLHGASEDHTIWQRGTSLDRYLGGLPLMVVMPDGGLGWYTNSDQGAYEDALVKDVVGLVESTFLVKSERAGRAIGGVSMGGYGAVKLGLKHHEMFCSVHSQSGSLGVVHPGEPSRAKTLPADLNLVFGGDAYNGPNDPFAIVGRIDHGRIPALRVDCGKDDTLLGQNRRFHAHLDAMHVQHEYEEYPGNHSWDYWDRHLPEAIAFHARNLKAKRG